MEATACRNSYGNCTLAESDDGHAVQCIGAWSLEKHDYLKRYIDATANPRRIFITPSAKFGRTAGAAFIDLFAGPGRARVKGAGCAMASDAFVDGSPLIALHHSKSPFTKVILCEFEPENVEALRARTHAFGNRVAIVPGDCNQTIEEVVTLVPKEGLNIAMIDPYSVSPLSFGTVARLCEFRRMDLFIHFPTLAIRRHFRKPETQHYIDQFMGGQEWRSEVRRPSDVPRLIPILRRRLSEFGYTEGEVRDQPVSQPVRHGNTVLYHVVYASKHSLGNDIWHKVARIGAGGQRRLSWT